MSDIGFSNVFSDGFKRLFDPLVAFSEKIMKRSLAHFAPQQIRQNLTGSLVGNHLVHIQINRHRLNQFAVLDWGVYALWEARFIDMAAGTGFFFRSMLCDQYRDSRDIKNLPFHDLIRSLVLEGFLATLALRHAMVFNDIRRVRRVEG